MVRRATRRPWLWGAAVGVALAAPSPALAQPAPTPAGEACADLDTPIGLAVHERTARRYAGAVEILRDLAARCPQPQVFAQLALVEMDLQRWGDAWEHLDRALLADDAWVRPRRAALLVARAELRPHMVQLAITSPTAGAELWVDGRRRASLPTAEPVPAGPGTVRVEVRAPGYVTAQRVYVAGEGQRVEESVALAPARASSATPTPSPRGPHPAPVVVERRWPALRVAGFALLAGGGAALLVGSIFVGRTVDQSSSLESATAASPEPYAGFVRLVTSPAYTPTDRSVDTACAFAEQNTGVPGAASALSLCRANDSARTLAWTFGLGGLALAGAGLALVLTHPTVTTTSRAGAVHVAPMVGARAWGATLGVEF